MLLVPRMVGWVPGGLGSQSWTGLGRQQGGREEVASVLRAGQAPGPARAGPSGVLGRGPAPSPHLRWASLTPPISLQLQLEKHKGEILGVVVVESGWGSILPTVILANMMNGGPAARSGKLSIGDQIMSINGTSLVGLPLATCQGIIKVGAGPHLAISSLLCNPP